MASPSAKRRRHEQADDVDEVNEEPDFLRLRTLEEELFHARVEEAVKLFETDAFTRSRGLGRILHAKVFRRNDGVYRSKAIEPHMKPLAAHLDKLYAQRESKTNEDDPCTFLTSEFDPAGEVLRIHVMRDDQ